VLSLPFAQLRLGRLQEVVGRGHIQGVTQLQTQRVLQDGLEALHGGCFLAVVVGSAVPIVDGFQLRIVTLRNQFPCQLGNQVGNNAAFGSRQPFLTAGAVKAVHHLDLQLHRVLDQRNQLADVCSLVRRNGRLPGSQPGTALLDLLDQRVECFLPFGQAGLIMAGGDADGPDASPGHVLTSFKKKRGARAFRSSSFRQKKASMIRFPTN
jgi:hypothetical protein